MRRLLPFIAVALAIAPMRATQTTAPRTSIHGRTINALTREPVRGAIVHANLDRGATSNAPPEIEFLTDVNGRFVLNDLAAGTYGLVASKTGYVDAVGQQIRLAGGESKRDVVIALTPEALISGRVLDQSGEPIGRISVQAASVADGHRTSATTDQDGRYSIGGLAAGAYIVGVRRQTLVVEEMYFPSAAKPEDATPIAVKVAEERAGVDFTARVGFPVPGPPVRLAPGMTGTVAGVVRDSDGRGLRQVIVALASFDVASTGNVRGSIRTSVTDADGRFRFEYVQAGRFRLIAGRSNTFVQTGEALNGTRIDVAPDQSILDVSVTLAKLLTVSGTVRDQHGDPIAATVALSTTSGAGPAIASVAMADSHGRYSLSGLQPGDYLVAVDRASLGRNLRMFDDTGVERAVAYKPVYHPGVADAALATPLVLSDRDIAGFDLMVRPSPASTIDAIVDPADRALGNVQLQVISLDPLNGRRSKMPAPIDLTPVVLQGMPAGQYLLVASGYEFGADNSRTQTFWARQQIATDGISPQTVRLLLEPAARVSGRVVLEGTSQPPTQINVNVRPVSQADLLAGPTSNQATVGAGGVTFAVDGVMPGRFLLDGAALGYSSQQVWMLKSVVTQGRDIFDLPIDLSAGGGLSDVVLTFTDQPNASEVTGTLTDAAGRPIPEGAVVIFSADARYWHETSHHVRVALADGQGRYTAAGLPQGVYRAASLSVYQNRSLAPVLTKLLPTAVAFTLRDGEHRVVDVRQVK